MNASTSARRPAVTLNPYSARSARHHVSFFCRVPGATQVSLIGEFNRWQSNANPMCQTPDGAWMTSLELPHGHYQYLFLIDGKPTLDPNAVGTTRNERNETVSLIAIS